ncbi:hypothetical protein [Nonlabens dokdonensis]|uniref:hypothetical protein n=1 Tax=Nonlabens dokdonensis TaxID=328515 RepID=UPI0026EF7340|nr:hypothetical protein [Nonlabens dokdonensis]
MSNRRSAPQSTTPNVGGPSAFKMLITIMAAADVLVVPSRDAGMVNMLGNVVLRSGAKMDSFYASPSEIKPGFDPEGEEDAIGIMQKLEAMHPGNEITSKEFVAAWNGVPAYIIVNYCDGRASEFYGTECAPMNLKAAFAADKDKTGFTFTFEQFKRTRLVPGDYTGDQSFTEANTPSGFALDLLKANDSQQYDLEASATASTSITVSSTDLETRTKITLVGGGGANPATLANGGEIHLIGGTSWTAIKNATITLEAFYNGTDILLFEKERS